MTKNNEPDELNKEFLRRLNEEDPFGFDEEIKTILFVCAQCGEEDDVPEFVVQEFQVDKRGNKDVETVCPSCGGTMRRARINPK